MKKKVSKTKKKVSKKNKSRNPKLREFTKNVLELGIINNDEELFKLLLDDFYTTNPRATSCLGHLEKYGGEEERLLPYFIEKIKEKFIFKMLECLEKMDGEWRKNQSSIERNK